MTDYAKSIGSFRAAYLELDRTLGDYGKDLSFRQELDEALAKMLTDFDCLDLQFAIFDRKEELFFEGLGDDACVVVDARLERTGRLLRHLAGHLQTHAEKSSIERVIRSVDGLAISDAVDLSIIPRQSRTWSETTSEFRKLMLRDWPVYHQQTPQPPAFWETFHAQTRQLPGTRRRIGKCRKLSSIRQSLKVNYSRIFVHLRSLSAKMMVLRPSDIPFFIAQFPLSVELHLITQATREEGSGWDFLQAAWGRPNCIVFVQSEGQRLAYFLERPWVGHEGSSEVRGVFLHLSDKRIQGFRLDRGHNVEKFSQRFGPTLVCSRSWTCPYPLANSHRLTLSGLTS